MSVPTVKASWTMAEVQLIQQALALAEKRILEIAYNARDDQGARQHAKKELADLRIKLDLCREALEHQGRARRIQEQLNLEPD